MTQRCLGILLAAALVACNRGPEPSAEASGGTMAPATSEMATEMAPNPHGMAPNPHGMSPHGGTAGMGAPRPPSSVSEQTPELAQVRWSVREPLQWRQPTRPMRNGEYVVGAGDAEAVLTVFHFPGMGGAVEDNVQRWVGQFRGADGAPVSMDDARQQQRTINGLEVTSVDVSGTFASSMGGGGPQEGYRLLGAIVTGPRGPIFFKLLGPAATVASAEDAFDALLESLEPTG